jgi:hypothetical protein
LQQAAIETQVTLHGATTPHSLGPADSHATQGDASLASQIMRQIRKHRRGEPHHFGLDRGQRNAAIA